MLWVFGVAPSQEKVRHEIDLALRVWEIAQVKGVQKDARFSKIKNISDLLFDDKEGKMMWNIDF